MSDEKFWSLVEASTAAGEDQAAALRGALEAMPAAEIAAFDVQWRRQLSRAYTWDLWGAAYLINGGCSDDGFEYFRHWLVGRGRAVFEAALKDPESLVEVAHPDAEDEALGYVAMEAYETVAGDDLPDDAPPDPEEPAGTRWEEEDLPGKFPRLSAKFA